MAHIVKTNICTRLAAQDLEDEYLMFSHAIVPLS